MFVVPESKRSIKQNVFEFKLGAKQFTLPKIQYLTLDQFAAIETIGDGSKVSDIRDAFAAVDTKVGGIIGGLDKEQLMALFTAWQEASTVAVGESEAS